MPVMLLIVAGCALASAWLLWVVVDSYSKMVSASEEKRLKERDDTLTQVAAATSGGSAAMTLILLGHAHAQPESTGTKGFLAILAVYVLVCAGCVWATDHLDGARHRNRIRDLLTIALWAAAGAAFLALLGAVTDPGAREVVGAVVGAVGAFLEGLLTLVAIVVTVVVTLGFMILMSGEDQNTPRRPKGMSRQVWNRQQREWREYKRKHGIDRSGGAGYSGGSGDGGDGGDGGD
ncbi:hypothetical protein ABZ234_01080 [Nocardiopsis sp. NPDC006198]|uniref:hypothetical protein n=1 Tax=Nocardiopsis sp. NPDC006198 TaxID=3154472 RepID=UPI0033A09CF9